MQKMNNKVLVRRSKFDPFDFDRNEKIRAYFLESKQEKEN
jgi:hypothetical protein